MFRVAIPENSMSPRRLVFILIALVVSATTVLAGRAWLRAERPVAVAAPAPAQIMPQVLVAKGRLPAGHFVRPEDLRWQPWPANGVAANYIVEGKHKLDEFVGAVVRTGLNDGEPITDARVVRPGDRGFMAAVLTPGYRAVTVQVTATTGLAGFVFPGDHVDLLLTFAVPAEGPSKREHRAAETILTNLRVLAVDQRVDDQNKKVVVAKTATLEVTPKQAEVIAVATELGRLSLSLRSLATVASKDPPKRYSHTWDSDATHLLPPISPADAAFKVKVVRGGAVKEVDFARSGR
jgi:pilus assembly protein CpaB